MFKDLGDDYFNTKPRAASPPSSHPTRTTRLRGHPRSLPRHLRIDNPEPAPDQTRASPEPLTHAQSRERRRNASGHFTQIEHRLFSYISINWRAKPLVSRQTVIDLIASTTTSTGLKVYARLDTNSCPTKIQVTDEQMHAVKLTGEDFHPEWNYNIIPSLKKK